MSRTNRDADHLDALQQMGTELRRDLHLDPRGAIERAEAAEPRAPLDETDIAALKAGIFIDAGGDLQDANTVNRGVEILRELLKTKPARLDLTYNLANGLSALAQCTQPDGQRYWYLLTSQMRREARRLFEDVASSAPNRSLAAQAKTNQANLLWQSHRWVEAYEAYRRAIRLDPSNVVASSGAARLLLEVADRGLGPRKALEGIAVRYIALARKYGDQSPDIPPQLKDLIEELPDPDGLPTWTAQVEGEDGYKSFVAEHHLALTLSLEGLRDDLKRWDNLIIGSIVEDLDKTSDPESSPSGVPPTFAAFNQLKADYIAARWSAFQAIAGDPPETGYYADTLDYALYGIRQSLLMIAQRAAIDLLDRVAVAVSEYLNLPGSPDSISFTNRWHRFENNKPVQPPEWLPEITKEVADGNLALVALAEMAEDIARGGALDPQRTLRNVSTHQLAILHDIGTNPSRDSQLITHYDVGEFERQTLDALRIARAAIFYFAALVGRREAVRGKKKDGVVPPLHVPPHHEIRGDDE